MNRISKSPLMGDFHFFHRTNTCIHLLRASTSHVCFSSLELIHCYFDFDPVSSVPTCCQPVKENLNFMTWKVLRYLRDRLRNTDTIALTATFYLRIAQNHILP